jgi:hypothetical protein
MLNRSVLTLRAKQPFLDWLRSLPDPVSDEVTLETLSEDNTAYLTPDHEDNDERDEILEQAFGLIFEDQLAGWWTEEEAWPEDRSLATFLAWFDVAWHSLVEDLVDGPLIDDDL